MCARMMSRSASLSLCSTGGRPSSFMANAVIKEWIEQKSERKKVKMRGLFVRQRTNVWTKMNHFSLQ